MCKPIYTPFLKSFYNELLDVSGSSSIVSENDDAGAGVCTHQPSIGSSSTQDDQSWLRNFNFISLPQHIEEQLRICHMAGSTVIPTWVIKQIVDMLFNDIIKHQRYDP